MFVSGFNIEVSFQSTVEEHYFDIKERDFVETTKFIYVIRVK